MKYFIFEGADGSGKTSIRDEVAMKLEKRLGEDSKYTVRSVEEPMFTGPYRDLIMSEGGDLREDVLLFMADRIRLFNTFEENEIILSDRSFISTIVYQYLYQGNEINLNSELLFKLLNYVGIPDFTQVYLILSTINHGVSINKYDKVERGKIQDYYLYLKDSVLEKGEGLSLWDTRLLEEIKNRKQKYWNNSMADYNQIVEEIVIDIMTYLK